MGKITELGYIKEVKLLQNFNPQKAGKTQRFNENLEIYTRYLEQRGRGKERMSDGELNRYAIINNRDWSIEVSKRVNWLRGVLESTGAEGFVFGNSGGKDAALVGVLCRMASENTIGVKMPCNTPQNFSSDRDHADLLAQEFEIIQLEANLHDAFYEIHNNIPIHLDKDARVNIAPRLRMTTLYAIALQKGLLVVGTGNRSERHVGYFTKFGDGGCDINPISDLTASEVYAMAKFLEVPDEILEKAPSAGLEEGQTDEGELGFSYKELDEYILGLGDLNANIETKLKIDQLNRRSEHKRNLPMLFAEVDF